MNGKQRGVGKTAVKTPVPQPHGGALHRGGVRGNRGGSGRPPNWFRERCAELASRDDTLRALEQVLADPNHALFIQALKFAADRGFGVPKQTVDLEGQVQIIVGAGRLGVDADG